MDSILLNIINTLEENIGLLILLPQLYSSQLFILFKIIFN